MMAYCYFPVLNVCSRMSKIMSYKIVQFVYICEFCVFRYQFNPSYFQTSVTATILLKSLTNLPHTDFTLCKCLVDAARVS